MPIYTKKGDKGETVLPGKRRVHKNEAVLDFLGSLDETSAVLAVVKSHKDLDGVISRGPSLVHLQSDLLLIGGFTASSNARYDLETLTKRIYEMEKTIDYWEESLPKLTNFLIPGETELGSLVHLARSVARRTERSYYHTAKQNPIICQYLNRLSDYLFILARAINKQNGKNERLWKIC